jgi:hypothetical protein
VAAFAENVETAYLSGPGGNSSGWVTSPVTGGTYYMTCLVFSGDGAVTSTGGNNASVTFG